MLPSDSDIQLQLSDDRSPITLRDHQKAASDRLTAYFVDGDGKAGLVVVPTGGGKTVIAAHWLLEHHVHQGGRVLWLAHRHTLLHQAFDTFRQLGNVAFPKETLGLITVSSGDARWSNVAPEHDVVFASMQTAVRENNTGFVHLMRELSPRGLFVVIDEAHHAPAAGYSRLLRMLKEAGCKLLGLTATPVRTDEADQRRLSALFDNKKVYEITSRELTQKGILAEASFETVKTEVKLEKDFTPEDYSYLKRYGELGPAVLARLAKHAGRNKLIVEHYVKKRTTYGPTIVFAADTLHASTLAEEFQKAGVDADYVDYSRKDARAVIQRYQEKKSPDVLVNVEMLTEGFDAPHTRSVFIARPTRSEALLKQMVGRALRGKQSNGNDTAYLVTFLDTWEQFDVLTAEYVLGTPEDSEAKPGAPIDATRIPIPPALVQEAYRLLQSNMKGQLIGVFQCLPLGWYIWDETFEDDQQHRTVMVYEHQHEDIEKLLADYPNAESLPNDIGEEFASALVRKYFGDLPDPLPRWADVMALLVARQKGCELHWYAFEEKNDFDPVQIAKKIIEEDLAPKQRLAHLQEIWDTKAACRIVYRHDFKTFLEDVSREETALISPPSKQSLPEIVAIVPKSPPRAWPDGEQGYSLVTLRDAVLGVKRNFPTGTPLVADLQWSKQASKRIWGFFRYTDKTLSIDCALNSPDVPRFVAEFLMFHELLHADMPSAGHNADFRARERAFQPSLEAIEEAAGRGIEPKAIPDYWRVRANVFLDTFERYFAHERPGKRMGM